MPWADITRRNCAREAARYASDLSDGRVGAYCAAATGTEAGRTAASGEPARGGERDPLHGGRKRHIVTDTSGLLVGLAVHSAAIQDRDGAAQVLQSIVKRWPWLRHVFAAGGYAGPKQKGALKRIGRFALEIVKRTEKAKGFEVLPRRWVVERTFAWLGRCRRLARDFEKTIASAEAWILVASIRMLTRRLARS